MPKLWNAETILGVTNPLYLDRIVTIAEGNARLAMLAGKLAAATNQLGSIRDASELYNAYYRKQIEAITDSKTGMVSSGIMAFFQALRLSHLEPLAPIFDVADVDQEQFVADLRHLHDVELVDICHDEAAKISDQSFSNYLIKFVFIDKKVIPLSQMIQCCFSINKTRAITACNILLSVFSGQNVHE